VLLAEQDAGQCLSLEVDERVSLKLCKVAHLVDEEL